MNAMRSYKNGEWLIWKGRGKRISSNENDGLDCSSKTVALQLAIHSVGQQQELRTIKINRKPKKNFGMERLRKINQEYEGFKDLVVGLPKIWNQIGLRSRSSIPVMLTFKRFIPTWLFFQKREAHISSGRKC